MVNVAILLHLLLFYLLPGVLALRFLGQAASTQNPAKRRRAAIGFAGLTALLAYFGFNSYRYNKNEEQNELGTYQLTAYPNCQPCELELQENNVFVVRQRAAIRETGRWHFESGQDYWITYLNEHDQLGSGRYQYTHYRLKRPRP